MNNTVNRLARGYSQPLTSDQQRVGLLRHFQRDILLTHHA